VHSGHRLGTAQLAKWKAEDTGEGDFQQWGPTVTAAGGGPEATHNCPPLCGLTRPTPSHAGSRRLHLPLTQCPSVTLADTCWSCCDRELDHGQCLSGAISGPWMTCDWAWAWVAVHLVTQLRCRSKPHISGSALVTDRQVVVTVTVAAPALRSGHHQFCH
jgi:hypothetical protein